MPKIQLLNIDCMELMANTPDKFYDLAICDPPYGIDIEQRVFKDNKKWDSTIPDKEYFTELFRVSKNQVIWGGNYFLEHLYSTKCFLIWDKKITDTHTFSMSEFAWTSFNSCAKTFYSPPPGDRGFYNIDGGRIHPTQKPVRLYQWIIKNYAKEGDKIFDPNFGSASSAIASHNLGFEYIGCEIDLEYFEGGKNRYNAHTSQSKLF